MCRVTYDFGGDFPFVHFVLVPVNELIFGFVAFGFTNDFDLDVGLKLRLCSRGEQRY